MEKTSGTLGTAPQLIMTRLSNLSLTIYPMSRLEAIIINSDIKHLGIVEHKQLLSVKPTGNWAVSSSRNMTFKLTNSNDITTAVNLP